METYCLVGHRDQQTNSDNPGALRWEGKPEASNSTLMVRAPNSHQGHLRRLSGGSSMYTEAFKTSRD